MFVSVLVSNKNHSDNKNGFVLASRLMYKTRDVQELT